MAKRGGRPRKDVALHLVNGNPSKLSDEELEARRQEEAALRPAPLRPKKPEWLSKYGAEAWDAHVAELERLGLLTRLDVGAFALAMESLAVARYALEDLRPRKADGTPDRRSKGLATTEVDRAHGLMLKKHPSIAVFLQASGEYRRWCSEFGLTPSARLGLRPARSSGSATGGTGDDDGLDELLGT